jgi:2'-5' RNA ligase
MRALHRRWAFAGPTRSRRNRPQVIAKRASWLGVRYAIAMRPKARRAILCALPLPIMPRLFFALRPDAHERAALAHHAVDIARLTSGRPVPADNLHLTLVFLGERPDSLVPALEAAAAGLRGEAFTLEIDVIDTWRKPGIAWAGPSLMPTALRTLQSELADALALIGIAPEERPYAAHVTLVRKAQLGYTRTITPALSWLVRDFVLFVSESTRSGVAYRELACWPLSSAQFDGIDKSVG